MKKSILTFLASVIAFLSYAQLGIGTTSPNSTLDVRGSISTSFRAFTVSTTATAADNLLVFTGTAAATLTLPTAVGCDGRTYMVKNASTTGPTPVLTIATTSSQTIDAATSWTLTSVYETVTLISNGANWNVSAQSLPASSGTDWTQNGNSVASQKSIGTTSNFSLPFITNNTEKMRLTNTGSLGISTTSPNSTLDVRGSLSTSYRAFTTNTTATATDNLLMFTGTAAATLTLPTAVGCDGRTYMIKNASTTGPTPVLGIATTSSQTIDGAVSWSLTSANEAITLISNGANWNVSAQSLPGGSGVDWSQNGNSVVSQKSIGTISNFSLPFITNNTEKMRLTNTGNLGIGTSAFNASNPEKLVVDAGTTTSVNAIVGKGSIDNYLQLNIQNNSAGTSASSDVVATANNGSETTNYVDMGINGGSNTSNVMGAANDAYLYNIGQNLLVGTGTAAKSLVFMTGGTTQSTNERMRIDGNGNVGIGLTNPIYKLQVNASSNPLFLGGVQTGAGTDSLLTIINGVVKKVHTSALPTGTNWLITGNAGINTATNFLGTTDDKQMILKSNGQSFLEFGRRQTLGLTQGFIDYDNNDEKVTYVRSALQFEAPNAQFYKPKMFTDSNGNFRVKGSSAGTDYFEFGSTGSNNNGGFEFVVGDDGDEPMIFKSYNYLTGMSEIMRLQSGRMAVGSNAFNATNPEKLLIDAGVTTSYNLMTGKGSIDNYLQINVQNRSNGTSASSDLVATADNGTETINFVDMGVNSSAYNNNSVPVLNGINNTYLYGSGNDLTIGNLGNNKPIIFFTTPNATQSNAAERMRIDGSGNMGIGTTSPTQKLDISGNLRLSGAFMPGNTAGTAGQFLISTGAGTAPTWFDASGYAWLINGNSVASLKSIGTTNAFDLPFITNNTEKMRLTSSGNLGIGTSSFNATNPEKLVVDAGTTTSVNAIVGKGSIDSYLQLNIQNNSAGANASSDVVATANNGSETTNFIDMGINGGSNTSGVMGAANDGYLYNVGQNLLIGTGTAAKSLIFMTGGTTQSTNERLRIDGNGNVGIGITAPTSTFHLIGSQAMSIVTKTVNYTATASDYTIVCNNAGGITITLPAAAGCSGRIYVIKKISAALNNVTIDPNASETIDGATTRILTTQYESVMVQSNGTSWYILANN